MCYFMCNIFFVSFLYNIFILYIYIYNQVTLSYNRKICTTILKKLFVSARWSLLRSMHRLANILNCQLMNSYKLHHQKYYHLLNFHHHHTQSLPLHRPPHLTLHHQRVPCVHHHLYRLYHYYY